MAVVGQTERELQSKGIAYVKGTYDFAEHEHSYRFFIRLVKWNVAVIVVVLALMAIFLT